MKHNRSRSKRKRTDAAYVIQDSFLFDPKTVREVRRAVKQFLGGRRGVDF